MPVRDGLCDNTLGQCTCGTSSLVPRRFTINGVLNLLTRDGITYHWLSERTRGGGGSNKKRNKKMQHLVGHKGEKC